MAVNFPNNPNSGDVHSEGGASWRYNGYAWARIPDPGAKGEPGSKGQKGEVGLTGSTGQKGENTCCPYNYGHSWIICMV